MELNRTKCRGEKMLSLVGIKLHKNDFDQKWKIVSNTSESSTNETQSVNLLSKCSEKEHAETSQLTTQEVMKPDNLELAIEPQTSDYGRDVATRESPKELFEQTHTKVSFDNRNVEQTEDTTDEEKEPFSSDDSMADPNYASSEESSTSASSSNKTEDRRRLVPLEENKDEPNNNTNKKRTRKRKAAPSEWKRNKAKVLRNSGQAYNTINKGTAVLQRQMKVPCSDRCQLKCTSKFLEEERLAIFTKYWALADVVKQRAFIVTLMQEIHAKYAYPKLIDGKRKRTNNNAFYFMKNDEKVRVCKVFFISTLGITNRCIRSVISKKKGGNFEDMSGKHSKQKQVPDEIKNDIRGQIASIPKIESHYTRAHSEKEYIEGGKTLSLIHI